MKYIRTHTLCLILLTTLFACGEILPDHEHEHDHPHDHEHTHELHHTHTDGGIYFDGEIDDSKRADETDISAERHLEIKASMRKLHADVVAGNGEKYINQTFTFRGLLIGRDGEENSVQFWDALNEEETESIVFLIYYPPEMEEFFEGRDPIVYTVKTRINKTEVIFWQGLVEVNVTGILL